MKDQISCKSLLNVSVYFFQYSALFGEINVSASGRLSCGRTAVNICGLNRPRKSNIPGGHSVHPSAPREEELENVPSGHGKNVS